MEAISGTKGCAYCGGLGHRVTDCPKLRADTREQSKKQQDRFGGGTVSCEAAVLPVGSRDMQSAWAGSGQPSTFWQLSKHFLLLPLRLQSSGFGAEM